MSQEVPIIEGTKEQTRKLDEVYELHVSYQAPIQYINQSTYLRE